MAQTETERKEIYSHVGSGAQGSGRTPFISFLCRSRGQSTNSLCAQGSETSDSASLVYSLVKGL